VRPDHLVLGTRQDNVADMMAKGRQASTPVMSAAMKQKAARGERNGMAFLSAEQVAEMRTRYEQGGVLQKELAAEYGVSRSAVQLVLSGAVWQHADSFVGMRNFRNRNVRRGEEIHGSKLNPESVRTIRARYASDRTSHRAIAAEYGVSETTVRDLLNEKTWKEVGA
jgi:DNA invertase Pin-like site-specific DNA recombinase